jgi:hypothetical protein
MDAPFSEVVASKTTRGNWDSEGKLGLADLSSVGGPFVGPTITPAALPRKSPLTDPETPRLKGFSSDY